MVFRAKNTKQAITTWFGKQAYTSAPNRKRVQFVMNSIQNVLGSVATVYPGPDCDKDTYAYVFPDGSKCKNLDRIRHGISENPEAESRRQLALAQNPRNPEEESGIKTVASCSGHCTESISRVRD